HRKLTIDDREDDEIDGHRRAREIRRTVLFEEPFFVLTTRFAIPGLGLLRRAFHRMPSTIPNKKSPCHFLGRGTPYSSSRRRSVRRGMPSSRAARDWFPPQRSSTSRMRSRSLGSIGSLAALVGGAAVSAFDPKRR